jgi:hypothetical protein
MLVVNLFAGPGAGKSTGAAYIFSRLKMAGVNCELVTEFAKNLVWNERMREFQDQNYIFAKQNHKLFALEGKVDVAIVDSPLLLNLIYGEKNHCPQCFYDLVWHTHYQYRNLNVFVERIKPYVPVGRIQDANEARKIDGRILSILWDEPHTRIFGNEEGYEEAAKGVLGCLGGLKQQLT